DGQAGPRRALPVAAILRPGPRGDLAARRPEVPRDDQREQAAEAPDARALHRALAGAGLLRGEGRDRSLRPGMGRGAVPGREDVDSLDPAAPPPRRVETVAESPSRSAVRRGEESVARAGGVEVGDSRPLRLRSLLPEHVA